MVSINKILHMNNTIAKLLSILICMFFVIATCSNPLIQNEIVFGSDLYFHFFRIIGLADALAAGIDYPVGVYPFYFQGWGYAVGLFYPDLFLLPFACLHAMGLGIILTYKIFFLFLCFGCCLSSYFAGRGIAKSHAAGLFLMIGYGLSQYHLSNLFPRGALGESLAMIFVPLFIWGLYNFTEEKFSKPWILILAVIGLLLSHVLSSIILVCFGCIWCAFRINKLCNFSWLVPMLFSVMLVSALSCFYWLPFLEQIMSNDFSYSIPCHPTAECTLVFTKCLNPRDIFGLGAIGIFMMTFVPLALAALAYYRRGSLAIRMPAVFYCCALAIFALCMSVSFWAWMDDYSPVNIQFPWRLNILSHFFLCLSAAIILSQFKRCFYPVLGVFMGLAMLSSMFMSSGYRLIHYSKEQLYKDVLDVKHYYTPAGAGREWLPLNADLNEMFKNSKALYIQPNGKPAQGKYLESGGFGFSYQGEAGKYKVPLIWYKGYSVYLHDSQGQRTQLELTDADDASVLISIPEGLPQGEVLVSYQGTPIQKWSFYVSFVTALLTLLYLAFVCWRYAKKIKRDFAKSPKLSE